jgi:CheY-like chemotaxis protein
MAAPTVLVVDDDPYIRDALEDLLTEEGYRVLLARDGSDALGLLVGELPCVILLDIMMPVMDGPTFLRHIQASVAYRDIPVVVMTAVSGQIPPQLGLPVVPKPIEIHSLLDLVRQHCAPARMPRSESDAAAPAPPVSPAPDAETNGACGSAAHTPPPIS